MANVKKALKKAAKKLMKKPAKGKDKSVSKKTPVKKTGGKTAVGHDAAAKSKPSTASRRRKAIDDDQSSDDDLPPTDADEELDEDSLDDDLLVAEVEREEGHEDDSRPAEGEDAEENLPPQPLPSFGTDDAEGSETVLPSMEGMSILRETELNDVIVDVKRRSEANGGYITYEELNQILPSNIVDAIQSDRYLKILEALASTFRGRPVGLSTLASAVAEDPSTLEDVYEPYLLQQGLIVRTPQGRQATIAAFEHLNITPPTT